MFNFAVTVWFSFAPYTGEIASEFDLTVAEIGVVASIAIIAVPIGRILIGPITDRYGAPLVGGAVLVVVGVFSILSAFAQSYSVFVVARIGASLAGITFVIGIQHVSEWFEEENIGLAEGIFGGFGSASAGIGAYFTLPRIFGDNYAGPLFTTNWRAVFFYTGVLAIIFGILYYVFGEAAKSDAKRAATKEDISLRQWFYIASRHGALVLAIAYVMTFGLELSMNGWLGTYYREGFGQNDLVLAATFAATFSIAAGLFRPVSGYVSDRLATNERDILPWFEGRYREQWTFLTLLFIMVAMLAMTVAGLSGSLYAAVVASVFVGIACGSASGAVIAQIPSMFPHNSGTVAGIVGGTGTTGGIVYPLMFSAPFLPNLHVGYTIVALTMLPILLFVAWVFQPEIAETASEDGWVFDKPTRTPKTPAPADD